MVWEWFLKQIIHAAKTNQTQGIFNMRLQLVAAAKLVLKRFCLFLQVSRTIALSKATGLRLVPLIFSQNKCVTAQEHLLYTVNEMAAHQVTPPYTPNSYSTSNMCMCLWLYGLMVLAIFDPCQLRTAWITFSHGSRTVLEIDVFPCVFFGSVFLPVFLVICRILEVEIDISTVSATFWSWNSSFSREFATIWWNLYNQFLPDIIQNWLLQAKSSQIECCHTSLDR